MKRRLTHTTLMILAAGLAVVIATAQTTSQSTSGSQSSSGGTKGFAQGSGSATAKGSATGSGSGSGIMRISTPTHVIAYFPGAQFRSITQTGKERTLKAQAEYLQKLAAEGKVQMHGPWRDEPGALTILSVRTDDEAKQIMANDPAVAVGLYEAELRAWTVTIMGTGKAMNIGK